MDNMKVKKRSGKIIEVSFDKILNRIKILGNEVNLSMNYRSII